MVLYFQIKSEPPVAAFLNGVPGQSYARISGLHLVILTHWKMKPSSKNKDKSIDADLFELCDELRSDDGISPAEIQKRKQSELRRQNRSKPNHHAQQLCKQVLHVIDDALICECCDPILEDLRTISVQPKAGSSALEVVFATSECNLARISEMHAALKHVNGLLRSAVGGSIHRKRVPQLNFKIVPERRG